MFGSKYLVLRGSPELINNVYNLYTILPLSKADYGGILYI